MNWQGAEAYVAELVEGELVTDKAAQLRDIDVTSDGLTYSVKMQRAAARYGNASFEIELADDAGNTMPGNFARCEADRCVIVIPWPDRTETLCFHTSTLKWWLKKQDYPVKGLTLGALQSNEGRKYRHARNLIVPLKDLRSQCDWQVLESPAR